MVMFLKKIVIKMKNEIKKMINHNKCTNTIGVFCVFWKKSECVVKK